MPMSQDDTDYNRSIVKITLNKVAKGTSIIFFGGLLGALLLFFVRLIIIRNWSQSDFGIFSLALVIPSIIIVISTFGLKDAIVRNISYARGKYDQQQIIKLISSSFSIYILSGIIAGFTLFFSADFIASYFFKEPSLGIPLKIFSIAIPFTKVSGVIASFFRGYDRVEPRILFNEIIKNSIFLTLVGAIVLLGLSFINVYYAFLIATVISCVLILIYAIKKLSLIKIFTVKSIKKATIKHLIIFSLPLFGAALVTLTTKWIDTLMLGSIQIPGMDSVVNVALYNAVVPVSDLISFPLWSLALIYMPVVAGLYARKRYNEIKRNFTVIIKWIFLLTLPIFTIFFFFSPTIISFLYGNSYLPGATAFRVVSLGAIIINLFALSSQNLIVIGRTKLILGSYLVAAIVNISVNLILIPMYDIVGAAVASVISMAVAYLIMTGKIYSITKIQPFSKNLLKTAIIFIILQISLFYITTYFVTYNILYVVIFYLASNLIMLLSLLSTKSVDQEDLDMLETLSKRTGLKLKLIKKLFKKAM
jgi:O-antigen/teichoic acid export membrane protein